ncbi:histidine kinase [Pelomonas sp. SE-A7]|uniref:sensor histidine kinase n=1 Tax=Pelomonas sp. SE-A7 TaxID=3054953 RepID=UPI00259C80EE|nr:histidine kinase [Pelomonas sp. SE-A7]MDM4767763.1 histidine kinase [Pelomonas sp. SE-A7]
MSDIPASPALVVPPNPVAALRTMVNLRSALAVLAICVVHALSRMLAWVPYEPMSLLNWALELLVYTRQSLLTGTTVLLAIGLAEALLAAWRLGGAARLLVQGLAVAGGAMAGTLLRVQVFRWLAKEPMTSPVMTSWLISTSGLWFVLGCLGYALLQLLNHERAMQAELQRVQRDHEQLQAQQLEAQVSALNAQIEPHFLFNTLANVKRLFETSPERGRDMLRSLIAYLRAALPSMRQPESTLGQELDLVGNYLTILQMRMGERLSFGIASDAELADARLPPMVLPTLVENAIKHGLAPLPEGGRIEIRARREGPGSLVVEVRDNGQGFSGSGGSGVGLANTRARLAALFGEAAALELEAAQPRGVVARLRMPMLGVGA